MIFQKLHKQAMDVQDNVLFYGSHEWASEQRLAQVLASGSWKLRSFRDERISEHSLL